MLMSWLIDRKLVRKPALLRSGSYRYGVWGVLKYGYFIYYYLVRRFLGLEKAFGWFKMATELGRGAL